MGWRILTILYRGRCDGVTNQHQCTYLTIPDKQTITDTSCCATLGRISSTVGVELLSPLCLHVRFMGCLVLSVFHHNHEHAKAVPPCAVTLRLYRKTWIHKYRLCLSKHTFQCRLSSPIQTHAPQPYANGALSIVNKIGALVSTLTSSALT
jgi:hypothetical protein